MHVCRSAATTAQGPHHGRYTFTFQGRLRIAKQFSEGAVGRGDNGEFQSYTSLALQAAAVGQKVLLPVCAVWGSKNDRRTRTPYAQGVRSG